MRIGCARAPSRSVVSTQRLCCSTALRSSPSVLPAYFISLASRGSRMPQHLLIEAGIPEIGASEKPISEAPVSAAD
jgi:hypothetical protein